MIEVGNMIACQFDIEEKYCETFQILKNFMVHFALKLKNLKHKMRSILESGNYYTQLEHLLPEDKRISAQLSQPLQQRELARQRDSMVRLKELEEFRRNKSEVNINLLQKRSQHSNANLKGNTHLLIVPNIQGSSGKKLNSEGRTNALDDSSNSSTSFFSNMMQNVKKFDGDIHHSKLSKTSFSLKKIIKSLNHDNPDDLQSNQTASDRNNTEQG